MAVFLAKLRNSDLNSFLTSNTDLNAFCPFQHRGKLGSDTCLRDLLRPPLSCNVSIYSALHFFFRRMEIRICHGRNLPQQQQLGMAGQQSRYRCYRCQIQPPWTSHQVDPYRSRVLPSPVSSSSWKKQFYSVKPSFLRSK
jgi:hypothetical protein